MLLRRRNFLAGGLAGFSSLAAVPGWTSVTPGTLKLYHIHTAESLVIDYRHGNAIIASALREIDQLLRDFRTNQVESIDINLLDTLSLLFDRFGQLGRFEVISGFRSPRTNAALRRLSDGVAKNSFHMLGRAIDVRLIGTPTDRLRDAALALGRGGVGYYPESNFIHLDTGAVRSW